MYRTLVLTAAAAALIGCGNSGGGAAPKPAPPVVRKPSANCQAAADKIAGMMGSEPSGDDVATIKKECEDKLLSDADAQCIADAEGPIDVLKCPQTLTPELDAVDKQLGKGPCRAVTLAMQLVQVRQMQRIPPEQQEEAAQVFGVVIKHLGDSCRHDNWGTEAMTCFQETDPRRGMGCAEKVPPDIQKKINDAIKAELDGSPMADAEALDPSIEPTGIAACDRYLGLRYKVDTCPVLAPGTRKTLLAVVEPLEKPWRSLPRGAVAAAGDTLAPVCEQADDLLRPLAEQVGCL